MSNPVNNGTVIGRLARDPKVFTNSDGSKKVAFTLFANRNFKNQAGETVADAIPVEAFVRKETDITKTPFAAIHKGDQVAVNTSLRMDSYERNGEDVYELKVIINSITFMESRRVVQDRLAQRVNAVEVTNEAAATADPTHEADAEQPAPVENAMAAPYQEPQLPFGTN